MDIAPHEAWIRAGVTPPEVEPFEVCIEGANEIRLRFSAAARELFRREDNSGEPEVVADVLRSIGDLCQHHCASFPAELDEQALERALDETAPLGPKKKVMFLDSASNPELNRRGLPPYRPVQSDELSRVADLVGQIVTDRLCVPEGLVPDERRSQILNSVVAGLSDELAASITTLASEGLLEWMVVHHEQLVYQHANSRLTTPTRLACYGRAPELAKRLAKEMPELALTTAAARFLIEYMAARPPDGLRPISYSVYDQLLALAKETMDLGFLSDYAHYGLVDVQLQVLRSGRLGIEADSFRESRVRFLRSHAGGEIVRSQDAFYLHWQRPDVSYDEPELAHRLDQGVQAEFDRSLTDLLTLLAELTTLADARGGGPVVVDSDQARVMLSERLGWSEPEVAKAIGLFMLAPRDSFWEPEGWANTEVYPWRYNRALSYLRRPILSRRGISGREEIVWGARHIHAASHYFFELCFGGRLKAKSTPMKHVMSYIRKQDGRQFNDMVADVLEARPNVVVRQRVQKVANLWIERSSGETLGDIDVLLAQGNDKELIVIETKNLSLARTPAELSNQITKTFRIGGTKRSDSDRLLERTAWIARHVRMVLAWLGLDPRDADEWHVDAMMVIDHELLSPYLTEVPFRVIPLRELRVQQADN